MISVDVCQGKTVTRGLPPETIGAFLRLESRESGENNGANGDAPAPALPAPPAAPNAFAVSPVASTAEHRRDAPESEAPSAPPPADGTGNVPAAQAPDARSPGKKKKRPPLLWVDVNGPTEDDWKTLADQFNFHPLALEDARKKNQRAKMDAYSGYLFLTLRAWKETNGLTDDLADATAEIDVFLGPNYIVTIHDEQSTPVQETRLRLAQHPDQIRRTPSFLLYLLVDAVVDEFFPVMDALDVRIDTLEAAIYTAGAAIDLAPAVMLKKRLLIFRQAITPLRDIINQLLRTDDPALAPPDLRVYWQDVYDHTLRLIEQVDLHRDILGGVIDAMNAQINNRLNQVMKTLTAISTILMSAALISGIYGMNFEYMPELKWRYGYFGALGLMVLAAGGLAAYFRRIKWL